MLYRIFAATAFLLHMVWVSPVPAQTVSSSQPTPGVTVPFELVSGFLVVVNGRIGALGGLRFVIDTGTTTTIIDRKVAGRLKLRGRPGNVINFDRTSAVEWAELPDLSVGPLRVGATPVTIARLTDYSSFAESIDGILGLDLLVRSGKLFIDYDARTVSLAVPGENQQQNPPPSCFVVRIAVQGHPMRLVFDTGVGDIVLNRERLRSQIPDMLTVGPHAAVTIGRLRATQLDLPAVRIGSKEAVATVLLIEGPNEFSPPGVDGYIGPASLHAKHIDLDFVGRTLRWW